MKRMPILCRMLNFENDNNLIRILNRGIDDMENGRELEIEETFQKITELRNARRSVKINCD